MSNVRFPCRSPHTVAVPDPIVLTSCNPHREPGRAALVRNATVLRAACGNVYQYQPDQNVRSPAPTVLVTVGLTRPHQRPQNAANAGVSPMLGFKEITRT